MSTMTPQSPQYIVLEKIQKNIFAETEKKYRSRKFLDSESLIFIVYFQKNILKNGYFVSQEIGF